MDSVIICTMLKHNFQKFYNELNNEQREVVDTIDGPLLVLAGPGTGKTQLLSVRAANIILNKKALPENILILTYTNAAAKTMKERLAKIIGPEGYDVYVSTFHSFANSIILDSEEASNYIQEKIQITDIERIKAIEYILDHTKGISEVRPFRRPYCYVREILDKIGILKREGISPQEFLEIVKDIKPDGIYIEQKHIPKIKALAIIYEQYEKLKEGKNKEIFDERGRYDYDDMIMIALDALDKEPLLKKKYRDQYRYIMVDEFQDTNGAQLKFLLSLAETKSPNLCCVGDDDQSIYRFQGASIANFKELRRKFKNLKTISLKKNYRSTREIIDLSQRLIEILPEHERTGRKELICLRDFKKRAIEFYEFTTEEEEMCFLVEKIRQFESQIRSCEELTPDERKNPYNNIAILVRKRALIPKIIDTLLQAGIPYATDGKEDIRPELRVRQMLDVLEFANIEPENIEEKDRLLYKILISDYFKIPHKDILNFINQVNKRKRINKDEKLSILSEFLKEKETPPSFKQAVKALKRLLDNSPFKPVHTLLMEYIKDAGVYRFILERYNKDKILRMRELRALTSFVNMVKECDFSNPGIDLKGFVDEIRTRNEHDLPIQGDLVSLSQNGVRIFTAHGSKGQEYHSVIIPFALQDVSWPIKPRADTIPLPPGIVKYTQDIDSKEKIKELQRHDEIRLFYVAISRAKSNILFTSSPTEDRITSSFIRHLGLDTKRPFLEEEEILARSIFKTDKEDPFIGTEEILRDMVSDLSLNPTSLNNYLECPRKFLYDNVLLLPGPKKQSLVFGDAVHSALEALYRHYMETDRFPDFQFFKEKFLRALRFQGLEKGMELRCIEQFEGLRGYFAKISSNPVKPIGLENHMPINIDGIIFTGKYDKLEFEDSDKKALRVIDYKTGQAKEHARGIFNVRSLEDELCDAYLRQLVCYKLLYERDNSRRDKDMFVSHGVLVFVEPSDEDYIKYNIRKGESVEFKIELTEGMVDEMIGIIKNVWANIQQLHFERLPERDKKKCLYCDFDHICWGKG